MIDIRTLLPRNHVVLNLKAGTRTEAFAALVAPLAQDGIVTDPEQFLQALDAREAQVTTQLTGAVALPHARSPVVRRLGLAVGVAAEPGIEFSSEWDSPVRLLFLIAVPAFAPIAHLPLLQHLAKFSRNPAGVERLLACTTQARLINALSRYKGK